MRTDDSVAQQNHVNKVVGDQQSKSMKHLANKRGAKSIADAGRSQKSRTDDMKAKAYAQGILDTIYSQQVTGIGAGVENEGGVPEMPFTRGLSDALGGPAGPPMPPTPMGPPPMPPGPPGLPLPGLGGPPGMALPGPLPPGLAPSPPVAAGPLGVFSPNALLRQRIPR